MLGWVEKPSPVLSRMIESLIPTSPEPSLLTKKMAPPPSRLVRLRTTAVRTPGWRHHRRLASARTSVADEAAVDDLEAGMPVRQPSFTTR